jgi:hypothetical protein
MTLESIKKIRTLTTSDIYTGNEYTIAQLSSVKVIKCPELTLRVGDTLKLRLDRFQADVEIQVNNHPSAIYRIMADELANIIVVDED